MKTDRRIQLLTDESADAVPPGGGLTDEDARLDALLRMAADDIDAQIDYEGIRKRAVEAAKAKLAKRNRRRRAASYALFTAAAFMLGFAVLSVIGGIKPRHNGDITALNTPNGNGGELVRQVTLAPNADLVRKMDAGTVPDNESAELTEVVSELFPEELPAGMTKLVDQGASKICASGVDDSGETVSYVLALETSVPIELTVGEAGTVEADGELTYYWQISDGRYISVRFNGFEQNDADQMFESLSKQIVEAAAGD